LHDPRELPQVLLRSALASESAPAIRGDGIYLRTPVAGDHAEWADLRERSRAFLVPWEPTWPSDDLSRYAFRRRLKRYQREIREDSGYAFFLFRSQDDRLLGGARLSHIRRGVAQSCSLGYWMGEEHACKGYMTAAVRAIVPFIFGVLQLHRIEAACLPHNKASIRVLEKVGFRYEGLARSYLCINGSWQDHLLFGLVEDDVKHVDGAALPLDNARIDEKI
jgi:[ribosomal protein S5]-alanine N-acetyltransferase